jgi:pilus assembly protein Flp/PilA
MRELIRQMRDDSAGATAIEYSLIGTLVALAIIAGLTILGVDLSTAFATVATSLSP